MSKAALFIFEECRYACFIISVCIYLQTYFAKIVEHQSNSDCGALLQQSRRTALSRYSAGLFHSTISYYTRHVKQLHYHKAGRPAGS